MTEEKIILNEIGHLQDDVKEIKSDVKDIKKGFVPSATFWKIIGALFILAIGSYGAYL